MKPVLAIIILILLNGCSKHSIVPLSFNHSKKILAVQPIGNYSNGQLESIRNELSAFYNVPVIILESINMPVEKDNTIEGERYSADSIVAFLSKLTNDTIAGVVGLTHNDIFTLQPYKTQNNNELRSTGVFGTGYLPGIACVISDYRFRTKDTTIQNQRLRIVVIHELGHNLGLQHCVNDKCIMSEANGKISTLDNSGNDYCNDCKRKFKK